jgi:hypothetical protein
MRTRPKIRLAVLAVVVTGLAGGIGYATIPDPAGVIHGCYKPANGSLRVIDRSAGGACSSGERALSWNQAGPPGPAGTAGPTVLVRASTEPINESTLLVTYTVTAEQAGLNTIVASITAADRDGASGGVTGLACVVWVGDVGTNVAITLRDNGETDAGRADRQSVTVPGLQTLAAGDVVKVECAAHDGDEGETEGSVSFLLQRVAS